MQYTNKASRFIEAPAPPQPSFEKLHPRVATVTGDQAIEVFLLAENRLLREALARVLGKKSNIRVVAAVAFAPDIVLGIGELKPHILILDSAAFGASGLQFVTSVRQNVPGMKVVMIGMEADSETFLRSVRAGVTGYLLKEASAVEIAAAVRSVAYEEAACPPRLCLALFDYVARQSGRFPDLSTKLDLGLSRREQQLMQLVSGGLTNKEIAAQLNLSEQTVKNHVRNILRKLGVRDRLSAAEYCREQGFAM